MCLFRMQWTLLLTLSILRTITCTSPWVSFPRSPQVENFSWCSVILDTAWLVLKNKIYSIPILKHCKWAVIWSPTLSLSLSENLPMRPSQPLWHLGLPPEALVTSLRRKHPSGFSLYGKLQRLPSNQLFPNGPTLRLSPESSPSPSLRFRPSPSCSPLLPSFLTGTHSPHSLSSSASFQASPPNPPTHSG